MMEVEQGGRWVDLMIPVDAGFPLEARHEALSHVSRLPHDEQQTIRNIRLDDEPYPRQDFFASTDVEYVSVAPWPGDRHSATFAPLAERERSEFINRVVSQEELTPFQLGATYRLPRVLELGTEEPLL